MTGAARAVVKGKRWLLLTCWVHLSTHKKRQLNALFALNRRVMKAYLLKESLDPLWNYKYEGAMLRYLKSWIDQLRWQRLKPMEKLADMLLKHLLIRHERNATLLLQLHLSRYGANRRQEAIGSGTERAASAGGEDASRGSNDQCGCKAM